MPQYRYNAYSQWATEIVATSDTGTGFVSLPDIPCDEIVIYNPAAGVSLDIISSQRLNENPPTPTKFVTVDAPAGATIPVGGNAAEIAVRRNDQSVTPITVRFIWRKFRR